MYVYMHLKQFDTLGYIIGLAYNTTQMPIYYYQIIGWYVFFNLIYDI